MAKIPLMLPAHQDILSIKLVTNDEYAQPVRSALGVAGF
jgi:hypothetical protein